MQAGTGCGGCEGLVSKILKMELEKAGKTTNKAICEHFAYSRQELVHIVRSEKHSTFNQVRVVPKCLIVYKLLYD